MKTVLTLLAISIFPFFGFISQEEKRIAISREIVNNMVNEDFEKVQVEFTSTLKEQLSPQVMSQSWTSVLLQIGEFEKILSVSEKVVNDYIVVVSRCKFKRENASIEVTFNAEDKVIGLFFKP